MSSFPSTSSSNSSSSPLASYPNLIEELDQSLNQNMSQGLQFFDAVCLLVEEGQRQEATKLVASKIRSASVYRRSKIFEELGKTSIMCRIYLSHEFRSVHDCNFPRHDIFYGKSRYKPTPMFLYPAHSVTMVFGDNAHFNLGISNGGKPIRETIVLNVPQCRDIAMSNVHTLFVTHDGKLYGCGKASLLRIDGKESTDEYFKEPTLLRIPADEFVKEIWTEEDGSLILTDKFMYVIGSINSNEINRREATFLSANCKRIVLFGLERQAAKIRLFFDWPARSLSTSMFTLKPDEVNLKTSRLRAKVYIECPDGYLHFAFVSPPTDFTLCKLVLNGKLVEIKNVVKHYTSPDGKIVMKLKNGMLVKGRLEIVIWKKEESIWGSPRKTPDIKEIVAIVDEVPGSYGVETFCCSPDLENCIFQIGQTEQKLMHSFNKDLDDERDKTITREHRIMWEAVSRSSTTETIDSLCETLERILVMLNESDSVKILCRTPFSFGLMKMQRQIDQVISTPSHLNITIIDGEKSYAIKEVFEMILTTICLIHGQKNKISDSNIQQFGSLARTAEHLLAEEIAWADEEEGRTFHHDCRRVLLPSLKSVDIEKIVRDRVENGELEPNEIPIDLKIIVAEAPRSARYLISKTNKTLFELMYPDWAEKIENGCFNLTGSYVHNYFYKRFDFLADERATNWDYWLPDVARQIVHTTPAGNFLCRLMPKTPITDFAGPKTSSDDIWYLEASDGKRIPVHKFLIMLHSSRMQASRRFDSMQGVSKSETQEPTVIKTVVTSDTVENAIRALLDMSTLYDKNIDDVTAVLLFYDYHLMEEALDDGIEIIFKMFNDTNLDVLYWLFDKFEQRITPHLIEHERLILMSASEHIPPREFITRFSELVSVYMSLEKEFSPPLSRYNRYSPYDRKLDARYVMMFMIDSAADRDESLLKAFADDWKLDFETVWTIQMSKSKKSKKPRDGERKSEMNKKPRLG